MSTLKLDLSMFEEIPPVSNQMAYLAIRANASGHVSFNARLREKINWTKIMFMLHSREDIVVVKQSKSMERGYSIPKSYAVSASTFTRELVKRGVKLPARYIMSWNEDSGVWVGTRDKDFNNTPPLARAKRRKVPELKALV